MTSTAAPRLKIRKQVMWSAIVFLLLLPAVAMRLTSEINWTVSDFAAAAVLLSGAGLVYELAISRMVRGTRRMAAGLALLAAVLLIWAQGAVGVI